MASVKVLGNIMCNLYRIFQLIKILRRSGTVSDCKSDGCGFDYHSEKWIIFMNE